MHFRPLLAATALALSLGVAATSTNSAYALCIGACGPSTVTNGDITNAHGAYQWISTNGGISGGGSLGIANTTDGSRFISSVFSANNGAHLSYFFNYITTDGNDPNQGGLFPDYAWAQLRAADGITVVATLLTAQTDNVGNTVPASGAGFPAMNATTNPVSVVAGGGRNFSFLGGDSGSCFGGGCGHTDWIQSDYTIANAGFYTLVFGVSNVRDTLFDSAFAFTGILVDGNPVDPVGGEVPVPAALPLFATGLGVLALFTRRRKKAQQAA